MLKKMVIGIKLEIRQKKEDSISENQVNGITCNNYNHCFNFFLNLQFDFLVIFLVVLFKAWLR